MVTLTYHSSKGGDEGNVGRRWRKFGGRDGANVEGRVQIAVELELARDFN